MDPIAANATRIVHGPAPTRDFTAIPNSLLRDARLSYRARGVLVEILSHGPEWVPDAAEMSRRGKEGRDAVYAAFAELEAAGYLRRERYQVARGRWASRTIFYANPQVAPITDFQESVDQESVNQESVRPAAMDESAGRTDYGKQGIGKPGAIRSTETKNYSPPTPPEGGEPSPRRDAADAAARTEGAARAGSDKIAGEGRPKCRIPDDFQVTKEMAAWCMRNFPAIDGRYQTQKFVAYWQAMPGKKGEKVDWNQAWMRWIRKAAEISGARETRPGSLGARRSTTDERVQQALDLAEYFDQLGAGDATGSTRKGLGR